MASNSSASSKKKRSKLLELLLNTNWSKQSQQPANLIKLNKILLVCDANFIDEKSGQTPLCLAIQSQQINPKIQAQLQLQSQAQAQIDGNSNHHDSSSAASNVVMALVKNVVPSVGGSRIIESQMNLNSQQSYQLDYTESLSSLLSQASGGVNAAMLRSTKVTDLCHNTRAPLIERILLLMIKSGAQIGLCNTDGLTPIHVAAITSNFWALKTLLDLGAPADLLDSNSLTPLYHSILHKADLKVSQLLLNRRSASQQQQHNGFIPPASSVGTTDQQGWQEVHYAAKLGLDAHLDKLLYYGFDPHAKISGSGNTPLHVAAINDQLDCAKVLLMRGADKSLLNSSHQTARQVAIVAGNMDLAEFIGDHTQAQVIPFQDKPAIRLPPGGSLSTRHRLSNASLLSSSQSSVQLNLANQQQHHFLRHRTSVTSPLRLEHLMSNGNATASQHQQQQVHLLAASQQQHQPNGAELSNVSPCLSQRSCATTNTTSSSGVCCDGDAGSTSTNEDQQHQHQDDRLSTSKNCEQSGLSQSASQHSNVTIIAVNRANPTSSQLRRNFAATGNLRSSSSASSTNLQEEDETEADRRSLESIESSGSSFSDLQSLMSDERPLLTGSLVEATSEYKSGDPAHLQLQLNELIEVLEFEPKLMQAGQAPRMANKPMLYGRRLRDSQRGLFPSFCVRRSKLRLSNRKSDKKPTLASSNAVDPAATTTAGAVSAQNKAQQQANQPAQPLSHIEQLKRRLSTQLAQIVPQQQSNSTASLNRRPEGERIAQNEQPAQREQASQLVESQSLSDLDKCQVRQTAGMKFTQRHVMLKKINGGFGFVLRGAKVDPALVNSALTSGTVLDERLMHANNLMSLQYLDNIEHGSAAAAVDLKQGDFLVAVNEVDVRLKSHEQVVRMIRESGDRVRLTIASAVPTTQQQPPAYATNRKPRPPEPPKRDPSTTLSRNRGQRAKSMLLIESAQLQANNNQQQQQQSAQVEGLRQQLDLALQQTLRRQEQLQQQPQLPNQLLKQPIQQAGTFDADKPLPPISSPTSSLSDSANSNNTNNLISQQQNNPSNSIITRSESSSLPQFEPAHSLPPPPPPPLPPISAANIELQRQTSGELMQHQQLTPTLSSSSSSTLTTVASANPRVAPPAPPPKPQPSATSCAVHKQQHHQAGTRDHSARILASQQAQQINYKPAVITTSTLKRASISGPPPSSRAPAGLQQHHPHQRNFVLEPSQMGSNLIQCSEPHQHQQRHFNQQHQVQNQQALQDYQYACLMQARRSCACKACFYE